MRHSKWLWCSNAPKIISEYSFSKMTKNCPSSTCCDKPAYIPNSKYSQKQFPMLLALKWHIRNDSTMFQSQEKAVREAFNKKKRSKLGIRPNRGEGGLPRSQPLNRFLKNTQNALKHIINTKNSFPFST